MDSRETKRTVPVPSVGADEEQPISKTTTQSIAEETAENNPQEESLEEMLRDMRRMSDPAYLHTVSMNDLYQNVYLSRPPIIDGLLYPGTYLFAGAPKVGKSFLMAQLAYHVSMGLPLWGYPVHKGTVLYLALEDDHRRAGAAIPDVRHRGHRQSALCGLRKAAWRWPGRTAKEVRPGTPGHQADYH